MKLKCAVLDDYQNVALTMANWNKIRDRVDVLVFNKYINNELDLIELLYDFEIIVLMRERTPFTKNLINSLPNLKLLVTSGMRNKSIDLDAAKAKNIMVCGTNSLTGAPVELTWALILAAYRFIPTEVTNFKNNKWQSTIGLDLYGKTLGILGLGKIGARIAKIALAFGMNVIAWSQNLSIDETQKHGVKLASSKEELLLVSDIVTIHLVLSERTKDIIDLAELQLMKKTALLVNTSRAEIVNQEALIKILKDKSIFGAALDVFDVEPLPENSVLRTLDNVIATPHIGYVSENNYSTYYTEIVEDIDAFIKSNPIRQLY